MTCRVMEWILRELFCWSRRVLRTVEKIRVFGRVNPVSMEVIKTHFLQFELIRISHSKKSPRSPKIGRRGPLSLAGDSYFFLIWGCFSRDRQQLSRKKPDPSLREVWFVYGSPGWTRTNNPAINSRMLHHWATGECSRNTGVLCFERKRLK